jgi:hypothetical protein
MKLFRRRSNPSRTALGPHRRIARGKTIIALPEMGKMVVIIVFAVSLVIAVFLSQEYFFPLAQSGQIENSPEIKEDSSPPNGSTHDPSVKEILNLAAMIRFITDEQLSEGKALRYAGLIFHASQKNGVNPLEIIALIMAESRFKEGSINAKSGDYGLGQINWVHWGKDLGLTHQDLLDPAVNIYMTCHVYKYFGKDFGKYNRGHGVKSKAYVLNVKGFLSSLNAFAELNQEEVS